MGINLQTNATAAQQLSQINSMARSTTGSIAGNMGMIGNHVVKFNTHWDERLFSRTTSEMLDASNAMRSKLKSLIGEILGDNQAKFDELCQKIDGKGARSLLDRKVVADVIKQVETAANINLTEGDAQVAKYSSKDLDTSFSAIHDFTSRLIEAEHLAAVKKQENRAAVENMVKELTEGLKTSCKMQPAEAQKFEELVNAFRDELLANPNQDAKTSMNTIHYSIGLAARLATGGRMVPKDAPLSVMAIVDLRLPRASMFLSIAKGDEKLAMRLLASCNVQTANQLLGDKESLKRELEAKPLTAELLYTRLAGKAPDTNLDLKSLSPKELNETLDEVRDNKLTNDVQAQRPDDPLQHKIYKDLRSGILGVMADENLAKKIYCGTDEGLHIQLSDLTAVAPGYDLAAAQQLGMKGSLGMEGQLDGDLVRNCAVYTFGDETIDCAPLMHKSPTDPAAVQMRNQILDKLEKLCGGRNDQLLVTGFLLTQAGQFLAGCLPVSDALADHIPMNFKIEKNEETGSILLTVANRPETETDPTINYTFEIKPNGENEVISLDYKVLSKAEKEQVVLAGITKDLVANTSEKPAKLVSLINEKGSEAEKAGLANFKTGDLVNEKNVMTMVTRFQKAMPDATPAAIKSVSRQVFDFFAEIRLRQSIKGMEVSTFEQLMANYASNDDQINAYNYSMNPNQLSQAKGFMKDWLTTGFHKAQTNGGFSAETNVNALSQREYKAGSVTINGEMVSSKRSNEPIFDGTVEVTDDMLVCKSTGQSGTSEEYKIAFHQALIKAFPDKATRGLVSFFTSMAEGPKGFYANAFDYGDDFKLFGGQSKTVNIMMSLTKDGNMPHPIDASFEAKGLYDIKIAPDNKVTITLTSAEGSVYEGAGMQDLKLDSEDKCTLTLAYQKYETVITIDPSQRDADGYPIFTVDKLENVEID